jgi:hypothetical protein
MHPNCTIRIKYWPEVMRVQFNFNFMHFGTWTLVVGVKGGDLGCCLLTELRNIFEVRVNTAVVGCPWTVTDSRCFCLDRPVERVGSMRVDNYVIDRTVLFFVVFLAMVFLIRFMLAPD